MLLITCPWCGPRDEVEFRYGGQAHLAYPDPSAVDDAEWGSYLFVRDNPKGPFRERWRHSSGCRRWFNALRDTATNRILGVYTASTPEGTPPAGVADKVDASKGTPSGNVADTVDASRGTPSENVADAVDASKGTPSGNVAGTVDASGGTPPGGVAEGTPSGSVADTVEDSA